MTPTPQAMTPDRTPHLTPEELVDSRERQLPPARQAHAEACEVCRAALAQLDEVLLDVAAVDVPEPSPLFWDHLSARIRERIEHEPPPTATGREAEGEGPLARLTDWLTGWGAAPRWAFAAALFALCASLGWLAWSGLRDANGLRTSTPAPQMTQRGGSTPAGGSSPAPSAPSVSPAPSASATSGSTAASATPIESESQKENALAVSTATGGIDVDHVDQDWTLMLRMAEDISWDEAEGPSLDVRPAAVDRALVELTAEERDRLVQLVKADLARQKSS